MKFLSEDKKTEAVAKTFCMEHWVVFVLLAELVWVFVFACFGYLKCARISAAILSVFGILSQYLNPDVPKMKSFLESFGGVGHMTVWRAASSFSQDVVAFTAFPLAIITVLDVINGK